MSKKPVSAKQHICGLDPSPSSQTASNSVLTIQGAVTFLLRNKNAIIKLFFFFCRPKYSVSGCYKSAYVLVKSRIIFQGLEVRSMGSGCLGSCASPAAHQLWGSDALRLSFLICTKWGWYNAPHQWIHRAHWAAFWMTQRKENSAIQAVHFLFLFLFFNNKTRFFGFFWIIYLFILAVLGLYFCAQAVHFLSQAGSFDCILLCIIFCLLYCELV